MIANDFIELLQDSMPLVVDPTDNPAEDAFAARPYPCQAPLCVFEPSKTSLSERCLPLTYFSSTIR